MQSRYKTLALTSMILFSFYYVYDMPSALNKHLKLGVDYGAQKITLLYSIYAVPNMILPLFFGWKSRIRIKNVGMFLCILVFIGQVTFSIGVYRGSFMTMMVGRFIYGIGGESFTVIQNKMIADQFKGRELAFSMSISTSIARCGTVFNYLITPLLAKHFGISYSTALGSIITLLGLLLCMCTINEKSNIKFKNIHKLDKTHVEILDKYSSIETKNDQKEIEHNDYISANLDENDLIISKNITFSPKEKEFLLENELYDLRGGNYIPSNAFSFENEQPFCRDIENITQLVEESDPWASSFDSYNEVSLDKPFNIVSEVDRFFPATVRKTLEFEKPVKIFNEQDDDKEILLKPPKKRFDSGFSLLVGISFMFAVSWAPFSSIATIMLQKRYKVSHMEAGRLMATQEGISIVLTVMVGYIADIFGFKLIFTAIGSLLLILAHFIIFISYKSSILPILILGVAGPLTSCYWPCITYLVSADNLTTGFAIFTCILNVAYTFSPLMVSTLISHDPTYDTVEFFIISVSAMAFIFIVILCVLNLKLKLNLNRKSVA